MAVLNKIFFLETAHPAPHCYLMLFEVLTIFPEIVTAYLGSSMLKRAEAAGYLSFKVRNIRDFAIDKHHTTDDSPYGGGPGMVMKPEPIAAAFDAIQADRPNLDLRRIYFSPQGRQLTNSVARELAQCAGLVLLCGRYEGVDERIISRYVDDEISLGDFVLTGGELPALCLIDAVSRFVPGVLGNDLSAAHDSFSGDGLLDHPHYTRPEIFNGDTVPEVLLSGNHAHVEKWRREQALRRTMERRPDILAAAADRLSKSDKKYLSLLNHEFNSTPETPPADSAPADRSTLPELQPPDKEPNTQN